MPKQLAWTTTSPTKPGFYWARRIELITLSKAQEEVTIVKVCKYQLYGNDTLAVAEFESEQGSGLSDWTHWKGPLPQEISPLTPEETARVSTELVASTRAKQNKIWEQILKERQVASESA